MFFFINEDDDDEDDDEEKVEEDMEEDESTGCLLLIDLLFFHPNVFFNSVNHFGNILIDAGDGDGGDGGGDDGDGGLPEVCSMDIDNAMANCISASFSEEEEDSMIGFETTFGTCTTGGGITNISPDSILSITSSNQGAPNNLMAFLNLQCVRLLHCVALACSKL